MNIKKHPKPDYKYWAKAETWSQSKAALLLHGIDPDKYPSLNLGMRETPLELDAAKKTFKIIRSIPWMERHKGYYYPNIGISPVAILAEANLKNLPFPAPLKKLIQKRFEVEMKFKNLIHPQTHIEPVGNPKRPSLANRERNNYLKAIGLLAALLIDEKVKSSKNSQARLSASQIARLIIEKAEVLELDASGMKSIDRKITEAVELLNQEGKIVINL